MPTEAAGPRPGLDLDLDVEALRRDTPACRWVNHLNNAGSALPPTPVLEAQTAYLAREAELGGYEAADEAAGRIEEAYRQVARLVGARPRNIALVENATVAFAQALAAFDFEPGDALVTSRLDYPSNQLMYLSLARRRGLRVLRAEDLPDGGVDPDSVADLLRRERRCRVVALSWIPTNTGVIQDAAAVGEVCERFGVPYVVDACQAVGQLPVEVERLRCDYLAATARKFLRGPRGIGFLHVADRALKRGDHPLLLDIRGGTWTGADRFDLAPDARRFENWEFSYALVLGLGESARYAVEAGVEDCGLRARALAAYARERLSDVPGVEVLDRGWREGRELGAIVSATVAGRDADELVTALRERRIHTSASRRESGLLDMDAKGVASTLRVSPHYYNTRDEIDRLVEVLTDVAQAS